MKYKRSDLAYERQLLRSKERRAELKAKKLCISGSKHGPATHGVLCKRCRDTHNRSNGRVEARPE